tara:strand:- start:2244 stop:2615 length:372 start_codon:yes stop_codon:yes gene_type:complete
MKYTEKDLIMMYHTALRNMGLYTSLSLALLGYSRYYRGKGSMIYNVAFIIFSILFMVAAMVIGYYLIRDIELLHLVERGNGGQSQQYILRKWLDIPRVIVGLLGVITCFGVWTLIDQVRYGTH